MVQVRTYRHVAKLSMLCVGSSSGKGSLQFSPHIALFHGICFWKMRNPKRSEPLQILSFSMLMVV